MAAGKEIKKVQRTTKRYDDGQRRWVETAAIAAVKPELEVEHDGRNL